MGGGFLVKDFQRMECGGVNNRLKRKPRITDWRDTTQKKFSILNTLHLWTHRLLCKSVRANMKSGKYTVNKVTKGTTGSLTERLWQDEGKAQMCSK